MKHFSLLKAAVALIICNLFIFSCAVTGTVGGSIPEETESDGLSDDKFNVGGTLDFIDENNFLTDNSFGQGGGTEFVGVENLGFAKPTFANKAITSSYMPTSSVKELTHKGSVNSSEESSSSTELVPEITDIPPQSSSTTVQTPQSTSSTSESRPKPVESSSTESSSEEPASAPETSEPAETPESSEPPESSSSETPETSEPTGESETSEDPVEKPSDPSNEPTEDPNTEIFRVNNGGTEVSGKAVDIVTMIVENEIGSTFAPEAIKAQAVTAYTYVKYHNLHGNAPYCILRESTNTSVRTLVESVIGEAVYYNGEIIQAVYSASSAGSTASSQNVWGGYIPYLQGVYCELDELYDPNYGRKKTFSENEMKQRMFDNAGISLSGDPSTWFVIENRTEGKYVGDMTIGGNSYFIDKDGDTLKITGRRFREIIMEYDIRSSAFDIEYDANVGEFTVTTYGYGHGVGLSQNGEQPREILGLGLQEDTYVLFPRNGSLLITAGIRKKQTLLIDLRSVYYYVFGYVVFVSTGLDIS